MPLHDKLLVTAGPVVDEWGFYDPNRAGLAAVLDRLDAKANDPIRPSDTRTLISTVRDVRDRRRRD